MSGNIINLLFLILVVGAPILSWIAGKVKEAAEVKRLQDQARRNHEEQLRTGRAPEEASQERKDAARPARTAADLQALAERRQAQLRALRQRQVGRAVSTAPAPTAAPTPPTQRQGRSRSSQRPRQTGASSPAQQRQGQRRTVRSPQSRSAPAVRAVPEPPAPRRRQAKSAPGVTAAAPVLSAARRQHDRAAAEPPSAITSPLAQRPSRDELRRAIVLNELLGPPVAMRDE